MLKKIEKLFSIGLDRSHHRTREEKERALNSISHQPTLMHVNMTIKLIGSIDGL